MTMFNMVALKYFGLLAVLLCISEVNAIANIDDSAALKLAVGSTTTEFDISGLSIPVCRAAFKLIVTTTTPQGMKQVARVNADPRSADPTAMIVGVSSLDPNVSYRYFLRCGDYATDGDVFYSIARGSFTTAP